jgi:PBP1b-binding outer membrane lipoprotein LpoB
MFFTSLQGKHNMKYSLLSAALLALAVSACGQKEEAPAPAIEPAAEQPAAPVSEAPIGDTVEPIEAVPEEAAPVAPEGEAAAPAEAAPEETAAPVTQ